MPLPRGEDFGDAQLPALRADGTVAFTGRVEGRGGLIDDAIYVKRPGKRAKRVATVRGVWDLRYVRGRLTARVSLPGRRHALIRDVGTSRRRTIPLRGRAGLSAPAAAIAPDGRVAFTNGRRGVEAGIWFVSAGGKHKPLLATDWVPKAWTPDGRRLLVAKGGPRTKLGLMHPATGRVDEAGPVACGFAPVLEWR